MTGKAASRHRITSYQDTSFPGFLMLSVLLITLPIRSELYIIAIITNYMPIPPHDDADSPVLPRSGPVQSHVQELNDAWHN